MSIPAVERHSEPRPAPVVTVPADDLPDETNVMDNASETVPVENGDLETNAQDEHCD